MTARTVIARYEAIRGSRMVTCNHSAHKYDTPPVPSQEGTVTSTRCRFIGYTYFSNHYMLFISHALIDKGVSAFK
jgi:hypothetical protein